MNKIKIGETEFELPFQRESWAVYDADHRWICNTVDDLRTGNPIVAKTIAAALNAYFKPIDIITHCPKCHKQHIDAPEPENCKNCGVDKSSHNRSPNLKVATFDRGECNNFEPWLNAPHKEHRCKFCNHTYKPANVPTNGVAELGEKE